MDIRLVVLTLLTGALAGCVGDDVPDGAGSDGDGTDGSARGGDGPDADAADGGDGAVAAGGDDAAADDTASDAAPRASADLMNAVHRAAWLCQDAAVTVADSDPQGSDALRCEVSLSFMDTEVVVSSTGIPNHDLDSGPSPDKASVQGKTWRIPLQPRMADSITLAPERGAIAIAANGAAIYGPEEGSGGAAVANQYGYYEETREQVMLGVCDGHSGPGGEYHYHADANCMHWHVEDGKAGDGYAWDAMDPTVHSGIIGFAFDGFPIYGSYAWDTGTTEVVEMLSTYRFETATEGGENGWNGMDDFVYVEGAGHLDECNGRFHATPEFPDGIYAYHSTRHDFEGELGFPHFLMCYKGVVDESNFDNAGGAGGAPPGGGGGSGPDEGCTGPDGEPVKPRPDGSCPDGPPPSGPP